MSEEQTGALSPISFTFEYAGHGWGRASISDGVTTYDMEPSYPPGDPLFGLVAALDKVLTYGGEAGCTWEYEPAGDHWHLRRDGDILHISIMGERDALTRRSWPPNHGGVYFSATCNLWKFAAKLRTAVSRLEPVEEHYHDPTWVQETPEFRILCAFLDEHKRAHNSPSAKSKGP